MTPGSLIERFVELSVMLLVGAVALRVAVHLIESVWVVLAVILVVVGFVAGLTAWLRARHQGW